MSGSENVLHTEPRQFAFGLKFWCGKEYGSKAFGQSTQKNKVDINCGVKDCSDKRNHEIHFKYVGFAIYVIRTNTVKRELYILVWC